MNKFKEGVEDYIKNNDLSDLYDKNLIKELQEFNDKETMNTENQQDGLKFYGLSLENFKNISHKVIDIGGHSFDVIGPNGSGKSSIIQALCSPLDTKIVPSEPIKKGEERSKIEVILKGHVNGQPVKYTLDLHFSPANKKGRLVVMNDKDEIIKSPASFIKGLIGNVSFDVLKWLHETKERKLKMLKQLTGCEIEIDKINKAITDKKSDKKHKKERAEELEAVMKNHGYTQEEVEKYSNNIPVEPIQLEMQNISKSVENYTYMETQIRNFKNDITTEETSIANRRKDIDDFVAKSAAEIKRLKDLIAKEEERIITTVAQQEELITVSFEKINKAKGNLVKGDAWMASHTKPLSSEITQRLNDAIAHNEHFNIVSGLAEKQKEMLKAKTELTAIDTDIDKLEKERGGLISKSQLPIKGLSFTEDEIFIDGLPLEEGQQNTQSLFDIGVDVAIALNPGLKVIFLHDASLFDKKNLETIIRKIEAKGYQCVREIVGEGELDVKFSEAEVK